MLVKSYKQIRGDYADQVERRKAVCYETERSYAKEGYLGANLGAKMRNRGKKRARKM